MSPAALAEEPPTTPESNQQGDPHVDALNAYLTFGGNAAEAMTFYQNVLGGDLNMMSFRDAGMDMDGVMHAALEAPNDFHIFASDHYPGMGPDLSIGNNMQLSLSGDDADALRGFWDRLNEGGPVLMPLEKQMWGDTYGQVIDRFGIAWHVNISGA